MMNIPHEDTASGLSFRLRQAVGHPVARLFLLHGVGGTETNLIPLADAFDQRLELVFVRGPLGLGAEQYAWFHVRFGPQGPVINAAQAEESRQRLRKLVRSIGSNDVEVPVPALMAGFSQGGIMSAGVALTSPKDVRRFAILSGRILPEINPHLASIDELVQTSAFIAHGLYDDKLPVTFAEQAHVLLNRLGVQHELHMYPVGHTLSEEIVDDFSRWVNQQINLA
jgi:phospholipase/carboxylesterase